jgi:hypothetical protein
MPEPAARTSARYAETVPDQRWRLPTTGRGLLGNGASCREARLRGSFLRARLRPLSPSMLLCAFGPKLGMMIRRDYARTAVEVATLRRRRYYVTVTTFFALLAASLRPTSARRFPSACSCVWLLPLHGHCLGLHYRLAASGTIAPARTASRQPRRQVYLSDSRMHRPLSLLCLLRTPARASRSDGGLLRVVPPHRAYTALQQTQEPRQTRQLNPALRHARPRNPAWFSQRLTEPVASAQTVLSTSSRGCSSPYASPPTALQYSCN